MSKCCVFFGHRWISLTQKEQELLKTIAIRLITQEHVTDFIFGKYGDFDATAYRIVSDIKRQYPHIRRVLALAYIPKKQEDMDFLKSRYDHVYLPENTEIGPARFAISRRNRTLARECDFMICYIMSASGGAYAAMRTARAKGKPIFNLYSPDPI